jgi:protein-S-isoprenylcysteine O-methyltransferase Ste14
MINTLALLFVLGNFTLAWLLPLIFFRRDGRLNLMWALTALPFAVGPTLLCLAYFGIVATFPLPAAAVTGLQIAAIALAGLSAGLILWTIRTHEVPLSLWHQDRDEPVGIVTRGPYALFRHPFYVAFIVAALAALAAAPQLGLVICLVYAVAILNYTAAKEERRLLASEHGAEYAAYMKRSGRFWPLRAR